MVAPEQPFLGPMYSPAEALDPSAFIGLDSATEFLQDRAGKKQMLILLAGFEGSAAGGVLCVSPKESWRGS